MFTGLVEAVGRVMSINSAGQELVLAIEPGFDLSGCAVGDSISVDGVCLTVTGMNRGHFTADVSRETLGRSTLRHLKTGDRVNLERAMRLSDRLGGHMVSGHVDCVGKIEKMELRDKSWFVRISINEAFSRYTVEKGSIALDGISLTINSCGRGFFEVNVIPQTGKETTITSKNVGDAVNIETDIIGKYVEKLLSGHKADESMEKSKIDLEMLARHGFGD